MSNFKIILLHNTANISFSNTYDVGVSDATNSM